MWAFLIAKKLSKTITGICHKFMARGHLSSYWCEVTRRRVSRRRVRLAECKCKIIYRWNYQPLVYNTAQVYIYYERK